MLNKELLQTKQHLLDADEEKKRLAEESSQVRFTRVCGLSSERDTLSQCRFDVGPPSAAVNQY